MSELKVLIVEGDRVVVATHRNLQALVHDGKFRQDLFHRIYVFPLILPPLRERRDDILVLLSVLPGELTCFDSEDIGTCSEIFKQ